MTIFDGTFFYKDAFNRKTSRSLQVDAVDHAAAVVAMQALATTLDALSQCGILKFRVSLDVDFTTVIVPGSNVDAGLTASYELNVIGSDKLASQKVPAPFDVVFDDNGNLKITNNLVRDWELEMINGSFLISDGELPVALKSGQLDR